MFYKFKRAFYFLFLLVFAATAFAGPWLLPGNLGVKSDIDLLADAGLIKAPVMTWPIAWVNIGPELLSPETKAKLPKEPAAVQEAYQRIVTLYQQSYQPYKIQTAAYASGSNKLNPFRTFQYQPYADFATGVSAAYQMSHFADSLNISYYNAPNQSYSPYAHIDNSYAYFLLGNWAIGFDQFNRWWGPGYSDSMILSSNAEPFPALGIQRMDAEAFKTKWLHWIGPWSVSSVVSEDYANSMMWFTNIEFRPLESLQFEVSRNIIFGGDNTNASQGDLLQYVFTGTFSGSWPGTDPSPSPVTMPGTQAVDIGTTWSLLPVFKIPLTFYQQTLFNDFLGPYPVIPDCTDFLLGSSYTTNVHPGILRIYFEYEYNIENQYYWWGSRGGTLPAPNTYGGPYPYTYYGNILSSSLGSEGIGYTLGAILNENDGDSDNAMIRFLEPNSQSWGISGTPGYPFAQQNIIWASVGRTMILPHHIGQLSPQIGYIFIVSGVGMQPGLSATFTWSKNF